ncbi:MAG TPA: hypothetical protein VFO51_07285 [Sphingomicrobium sp.]|nr:hypothetical protein [Sphingomicrobium sp.]
MHIHVPKPIHGWKQFFNEVAVISVGIGIALTGEQLLERWHEREQSEKSLEAIQDEIALNLGKMRSRLETDECIAKRLDEIAAYVEASSSAPRKRPSWVGRPQVWNMQTSAVEAARSYGSLTVMQRPEQMAIASTYASMARFAEWQEEEQLAWSRLRSITEDRDLTDSDLSDLRHAIQRARYTAWSLRADATQALRDAAPLHVVPEKVTNGSQSVCVPMDTPFEEAVRKSGTADIGEPR